MTEQPMPRPTEPAADKPTHVLEVTDAAWTVHCQPDCTVSTPTGPVRVCNIADLVHDEQPDLPPGRYEVSVNDLGDRLLIGDRVNQPQD